MLNGHPNELPPLPRVPGMSGDPLIFRISHTGATLLKEGSFKKRFTGGEAVVDINGKLYTSKKDYLHALKKEEEDRIQYKISMGYPEKKARLTKTDKPGDKKSIGAKDTDVKIKKQYSVNKTEVTNRIACMTSAMFSHQKSGGFLGMLTITFPPAVNENIAMQALNTWLTALRQKGKRIIRQYLWVSERQDGKRLEDQSKATNTIHYHMLILNRVNIVAVNRAMRVVLCNLVRAGVITYPLAAMKRYNGVDLAKDRKTRVVTNFCDPKSRKALSFYITKYVTKNSALFDNAAWGCSRGFSALFTGLTCTYQEFIKMCWDDAVWQEPAVSNKYFDFFPWFKDTGPPWQFVDLLSRVNSYILRQKGFMN